MCCWFNHHFGLSTALLSILWYIFARVFPSQLSSDTSCQGAHSSHPLCVGTSHAPSLTHYSGHTLATDRVILLASMRHCGEGITLRPTIGTPTLNDLRSTWDFLPGRSPWHVGGSSTVNTFLQGYLEETFSFFSYRFSSWIIFSSSIFWNEISSLIKILDCGQGFEKIVIVAFPPVLNKLFSILLYNLRAYVLQMD